MYDACVAGRSDWLPWIVVNAAHTFFDGVAGLASGRCSRADARRASLVAATQRPSARPVAAVSQADLLVAHRLTVAVPTHLSGTLRERPPGVPVDAVIVDDAAESAHAVGIRDRPTPHGGSTRRRVGGPTVGRDGGAPLRIDVPKLPPAPTSTRPPWV